MPRNALNYHLTNLAAEAGAWLVSQAPFVCAFECMQDGIGLFVCYNALASHDGLQDELSTNRFQSLHGVFRDQ